MAASSLRNLNLSGDEISKLSKAFSDEKFRDLFRHYVDEINDPVNRKQYEEEITKLEKELGRDVLFVKPQASYVIKTIVNGIVKTYINFCTSEAITKFSSHDAKHNNIHGVNFSIPYSLSPVQSRRDKSNNIYNIYTMVFHPATLEYAEESVAFKKLVYDTAFAAVENSFNTRLDKINFVILKKSHKGCLEHTIIRQSDQFSNSLPLKENGHTANAYTEPAYSIVYRDQKDLQNCTNDTFSKLNALIPSHTLVEIKLPLLNSIQNTKLEIKSSLLHLQNDDPVKYKVSIPLIYEVDEDRSSAKFYPDSHVLKVEIPIIRKPNLNDHNNDELSQSTALITEINDKLENFKVDNVIKSEPLLPDHDSFLREDIKYKMPEYYCNYYQNKVAFVLKVRNVCYDSFKYRVFDDRKGCIMKFTTLGAGHFPMYYSFCVLFVDNLLQTEDPLQHLIEDENVFVYLHLDKKGSPPLEYLVGADKDDLKKSYLSEPEAIKLQIHDKQKESSPDVTLEVTKLAQEQVTLKISPESKPSMKTSTPKPKSEMTTGKIAANQEQLRNQFLDNINFSQFCTFKTNNSKGENQSWIVDSKNVKKCSRRKRSVEQKSEDGSFENNKSENEDQDSVFPEGASQPIDIHSAYKYADMSKGSILKKNRSFSESSGDELYHAETSRSFSVDDVTYSSDSYSQSAPKKTVTFNDVIFKKLYSSDISILEQRKRTKRRSQRKERRASESDTSETESNTDSSKSRQEHIRLYNENLQNSETELTSVSESGETSDDQSDTQEGVSKCKQSIPSSKKNHKRRGKKSARKNASTAKYNIHGDF